MYPTVPDKNKVYFLLKGCLVEWTERLQQVYFGATKVQADTPVKQTRTALGGMSSLHTSASKQRNKDKFVLMKLMLLNFIFIF